MGELPSSALAVERHDGLLGLGLDDIRASSPVPMGATRGAKRFRRTVICLTLGRRKTCDPSSPISTRRRGMQMRAWMGIAVVVAMGLIWSVAAMSKLVPVDGSEMKLAGTSQPAQ